MYIYVYVFLMYIYVYVFLYIFKCRAIGRPVLQVVFLFIFPFET